MAYYLLTVQLPGARSYTEAALAKHHIEARSLDDAKWRADQIADNHYARADKASLRLFDETGLVSARSGDGEWSP